jgi:hypothetical protein
MSGDDDEVHIIFIGVVCQGLSNPSRDYFPALLDAIEMHPIHQFLEIIFRGRLVPGIDASDLLLTDDIIARGWPEGFKDLHKYNFLNLRCLGESCQMGKDTLCQL